MADVDQYLTEHSSAAEKGNKEAHQARQSDHLKPASPYTVSFSCKFDTLPIEIYLE